MRDEVTGLHARGIRRRAVHRRHDLHEAFFLRDLDAKTAKLTACLNAHVSRIIRRQVA